MATKKVVRKALRAKDAVPKKRRKRRTRAQMAAAAEKVKKLQVKKEISEAKARVKDLEEYLRRLVREVARTEASLAKAHVKCDRLKAKYAEE
jgi:hypothetical protein